MKQLICPKNHKQCILCIHNKIHTKTEGCYDSPCNFNGEVYEYFDCVSVASFRKKKLEKLNESRKIKLENFQER